MTATLRFLLSVGLSLTAVAHAPAAEVSFLRDVAPILTGRCTGCHGAIKIEGDYRLHTFAYLQKPGESGEMPIIAGKPEASELFRRIVESDESIRMPQDDDPLSPAEIATIKRWIAAGAKFDGADTAASIKSLMPPREHPAPPHDYRVPVPVFAVAFSPDGRELAVGGNYEVNIWDPANGHLLRRIAHLPQRIQSLVYNHDGSELTVAGGSPGDYGEAAIVDPKSGQKLAVLGTSEDIMLGAALSHDGKLVALASADRWTRVFSTADRRRVWQSQLHSDWVTAVSFSADDRFLASASKDATIKVYEAASGELFTTFTGHQQQLDTSPDPGRFPVYDVAFAPAAPWAVSAGEGKAFRIWEPLKSKAESGTAREMEGRFAASGHTQFVKFGDASPVFKLAVGDDTFFSVSGNGLLKQFDVTSGNMVRQFAGHHDRVYALAWHADTNRLATGSNDGEVRIWDSTNGNTIATFYAAPGYKTTVANAAK